MYQNRLANSDMCISGTETPSLSSLVFRLRQEDITQGDSGLLAEVAGDSELYDLYISICIAPTSIGSFGSLDPVQHH
jgi:hypothetical protein